jgi:hypothetical protein
VSVPADNDINAIKNNGSIPEGYTINHYLTDNNAWFLTTDVPNGMKHFVRTPMSNSMDGDFDTGNVRYKSRERYSFGFSDPLWVCLVRKAHKLVFMRYCRGTSVPLFFLLIRYWFRWCITCVVTLQIPLDTPHST